MTTTTTIELTVPSGFSIDSFEAAPGWKRDRAGNRLRRGEDDPASDLVGRQVPTTRTPSSASTAAGLGKTYTFTVRQTYSNGKVVDWTGSESSDTPAPTIEAVSSFGGSSSTLTIVALIVGGIGVLLGIVGLATKGRPVA